APSPCRGAGSRLPAADRRRARRERPCWGRRCGALILLGRCGGQVTRWDGSRGGGARASGGSELPVDVLERDVLRDHHHLQVIEQLADLHRGVVLGLVLAGHPHLGGLLHDLLADLMDAAVEFADRSEERRVGNAELYWCATGLREEKGR